MLRKSVAESRENFYFWQQSLYMLRVLPAPGKLAFQQVTSLSCNFIQSGVSTHATCNNLICSKTGLNEGGKTHNIAFQLILQQCCKTSCTFLSPALL